MANYLADNQYSMRRFAALVEEAMRTAGVPVSIIRPEPLASRLAPRSSSLQKYLRSADKFVWFPPRLRRAARRFAREPGTVIHLLDQGNGVYVNSLAGLPLLVTCHDLIAAKESLGLLSDASARRASRTKPSSYQMMNLAALRKARWFSCASAATRAECISVLGASPDRCEVIYNPLPSFFREDEDGRARPASLPPRFLLNVGNAGWYKNRAWLLGTYAEMRRLGFDPPLVLMGGPLSATESDIVREKNIGPHVRPIPHPDDATVRAGYAHADAMIFPSLEEGFGWPVIEAQAQGCLVFTSNQAPMTEAGGTSARYIVPTDSSAAAAAMMAALHTDPRSPADVAARKTHAATFTMERFANEHLQLYRRIADEHKARPPVRH